MRAVPCPVIAAPERWAYSLSENNFKTAGFPEALVIAQGNAVAVMLPQAQLTKENSARILTLCMTYADVSAENIRLMDY